MTCPHAETQYFGDGVYRCAECGDMVDLPKIAFAPAADSRDAEAEARFAALAKLEANWDSYGGLPIDQRAIDCARRMMAVLSHPPQIVPMSDGGIQLEWHRDGIDVDLVIPAYGGTGFFGIEEDAQL